MSIAKKVIDKSQITKFWNQVNSMLSKNEPNSIEKNSSKRDVYECHITVQAKDQNDAKKFERVCQKLGIKVSHIVLPYGKNTSQLISSSFHHGSLHHVAGDISHIVEEIESRYKPKNKHGSKIIRIKLEAHNLTSNPYVPRQPDLTNSKKWNYFEMHAKFTLPTNDNLKKLQNICNQHHVHLSRSTNKKARIFGTARYYNMAMNSAVEKFNYFINETKKFDLPSLGQIKEYTIIDTHLDLDKGWGERVIQKENQ